MDRHTALSSATAYAAEVRKVFSPDSIIFYGSYVHGTPTPESDIDIAVIFDGYDGDWLKDSATLWGLTMNVSTLIEPVLLDRRKDSTGFVEQITSTGRVLYNAG